MKRYFYFTSIIMLASWVSCGRAPYTLKISAQADTRHVLDMDAGDAAQGTDQLWGDPSPDFGGSVQKTQ